MTGRFIHFRLHFFLLLYLFLQLSLNLILILFIVRIPNLRTFGLICRGLEDYLKVLPLVWLMFLFHIGLDISFGGLWRRLSLERPSFVHWVTSYIGYFISVTIIWMGWVLTYSINQKYYLLSLSLFMGFGSNMDGLYIFYEVFPPFFSSIATNMVAMSEVHFFIPMFLIGFAILSLLSLLLFLFPLVLFYTGFHLPDLVQKVTFHFPSS